MIAAIIPAYNEEASVSGAIKDAASHVDAVVVVDDCSVDSTSRVALRSGAYVLRHVINRGQGAALQTGTDYALQKLKADIIVHFDADGQMMGEEIPKMVEPIRQDRVDATLGSRFLGKSIGMPTHRLLFAKAARLFTLVVAGIWVTDAHCGFRALSKSAAGVIRITSDRMAHATDILDSIGSKKISYQEVPVTIRYTDETLEKGQRSSDALKVGLQLVKDKLLK